MAVSPQQQNPKQAPKEELDPSRAVIPLAITPLPSVVEGSEPNPRLLHRNFQIKFSPDQMVQIRSSFRTLPGTVVGIKVLDGINATSPTVLASEIVNCKDDYIQTFKMPASGVLKIDVVTLHNQGGNINEREFRLTGYADSDLIVGREHPVTPITVESLRSAESDAMNAEQAAKRNSERRRPLYKF